MILARASLFLLLVLVATVLPLRGEDAPIASPSISADHSPAAVAAAEQRGAATAAKDIQQGIWRILYAGPPLSRTSPPKDGETGYRIQMVGGCIADEVFDAEMEGYNRAMRQWHARHK